MLISISLRRPHELSFRRVERKKPKSQSWRNSSSRRVLSFATLRFSWWPWSRKGATADGVTDAIRLALAHARHGNTPGTFLAYGTDEGCILRAVADEPFDRIIGLESDALVAARVMRNIRRQVAREAAQRIEVLCEMAATFDVPDSVTTVFVWNVGVPLPLNDILRQLGQSLQHRPRSVRVIYAAPADADIAALMSCPWVDDVTPIPTFEHEEIRMIVLEHFGTGT